MLPNINLITENLLGGSVMFLPELLVCCTIVLLLLLRVLRLADRAHVGPIALILTLVILALSVCQWGGYLGFAAPDSTGKTEQMFGGMLVYDHLTVFLRCFLLGFAALMIWLTMLTGIPDRDDSADFYVLLLGATLGMMLMASANHLLMVFIGVEMASLPSYALAGFLKGRRLSSEAALKYVVYGGGAAGVMLYGISLLAGKFGTGYLPDLAAGYVHAVSAFDPVLILGTLFLLIGVGFKLAAVPFHFWCPDVFEGASAEVAGFLSVASKAAALALMIRLVLVFTGVDPLVNGDGNWMAVLHYIVPALAVFAGVTATFGNLAAFRQTNLKRLLAYSTIAHAGYMMMGICALTTPRLYLPGGQAVIGAEAVLFYLIAYLFMNLGAFAVVAFLRNETGSEDLSQMRGLVRRSPWMVVTLSLFLLSLLGIPPLIGFTAKVQIFYALWRAGQYYWGAGQSGLGFTLLALLGVGGVNTVISAVYYLKVMKVMIIEGRAEDIEGVEPARLREPAGAVFYATVLALVVFGLGLAWDPLSEVSAKGVERYFPHAVAANTAPAGGGGGPPGRRPGGAPGGRPGGRPGGGPRPGPAARLENQP